jgi:hypothetical protein
MGMLSPDNTTAIDLMKILRVILFCVFYTTMLVTSTAYIDEFVDNSKINDFFSGFIIYFYGIIGIYMPVFFLITYSKK